MNQFQKAIKIGAIVLAVFLILNIVNGIFWGFRLLSGTSFSSFDGEYYEESYDDIQKLDLDLSNLKITMIPGTSWNVVGKNVSKNFKMNEMDGHLKITEKSNWFYKNLNGEVIITFPKEEILQELNLKAGAGRIEIQDLTADELDLKQGAGSVNISNCEFRKEVEIKGGAGEIKMDNSTLQNLELDSGVGKVSLSGNILGKSKISCGVGEVNLRLDHESAYSFQFEKGIGSISINDEKWNGTRYGSGINQIKVKGGIGSISIDFKE